MKKDSFLFAGWIILTNSITPFLPFYLRQRCKKGKELPHRIKERYGYASQPNDNHSLIQFHAASVGELISIFPVVHAIHQLQPQQKFLITTGTITSFYILQRYLYHHSNLTSFIVHQFIPLDIQRWVNRFLTYWKPSLIVLTESELWPNFINLAHNKNIPLALINARLSDKSLKRWQYLPSLIQIILKKFNWITTQSTQDQHNFSKLGVKTDYFGNLKQIADKLQYNSQEFSTLQKRFQDKIIWLAASTHANEEKLIAKAHHALQKKWPHLLTIIVPRHPERSESIIKETGFIARRSLNEFPFENNLWLCDTLGELGLFYRLADLVFIGNSFSSIAKGGGHNPFEAAQLNCAIATGPQIQNFKQAYITLKKAVTIIHSLDDLINWVDIMLTFPEKRKEQASLALQIMEHKSHLAIDIAQHLLTLQKKSP